MTFIRGEIPYINYIRHRLDAQVHVMVTRERSGSGREYTLMFYGFETFSGLDQQLRYYTSDTDTDDERRRGFTRLLKLGLVPYVVQTPAGDPSSPWVVEQYLGRKHMCCSCSSRVAK